MSSDETQSPLARAYDLVEAGQLDEAKALLESILDEDSENADAWWIYAHAVTDPDVGRNALENVLSIDPNYPGAAELLAQADEMMSPQPTITPLAPQTMPEAPIGMPEDDFPEPGAVAPKAVTQRKAPPKKAPPPSPSRSPFPLIAVVVVIVIALVLLVLLLQNNATPLVTPTPTQVVEAVASPTAAVAEVTQEAMPTAAPLSTAESGAIDYSAIESALSEFPLAESGVGVVDTSLGSTLIVTACTTQGRAMRALLPQVMNALAKQSASLDSGVAAIGARMLDCTQNTPLVTVATDLASAQSYAGGNLTDAEFAATWKPQ